MNVHISRRLSHENDLSSCVIIGFEKDGVHSHVRIDPACLGLNGLGSAHLAAFAGDERVERHVLGLEGDHPISVLQEDSAQGSRQDALACIGARPLKHDGRSLSTIHPKRKGNFQRFSQRVKELQILVFAPDSNAKEPSAQTFEIIADANGDPRRKHLSCQTGSVHIWTIQAYQ
jgi:hypothetical protein